MVHFKIMKNKQTNQIIQIKNNDNNNYLLYYYSFVFRLYYIIHLKNIKLYVICVNCTSRVFRRK